MEIKTVEISEAFIKKAMSSDCSGADRKVLDHYIINGNLYGPTDTYTMLGISKAQYYRAIKRLREYGLLDDNNNPLFNM